MPKYDTDKLTLQFVINDLDLRLNAHWEAIKRLERGHDHHIGRLGTLERNQEADRQRIQSHDERLASLERWLDRTPPRLTCPCCGAEVVSLVEVLTLAGRVTDVQVCEQCDMRHGWIDQRIREKLK